MSDGEKVPWRIERADPTAMYIVTALRCLPGVVGFVKTADADNADMRKGNPSIIIETQGHHVISPTEHSEITGMTMAIPREYVFALITDLCIAANQLDDIKAAES